MAGAAGYRSQDEVFLNIMPCVATHAKRVKRIGPMSDKVIGRSGIFSYGAADKPFLIVTVAASKSLVTAIAYDPLTIAVMVTIAALCAIVHEVFFMAKYNRTGVDRRMNVFGTSSINGTVQIDDLGNGLLGNRYTNGRHDDPSACDPSKAYHQNSCVHRLLS